MPSLVVKLFITYILALWLCGKESKVDEEQHGCNLESDLIQENMTKSSQWFLRELRHFSRPWKREWRAQHKHGCRPDYVSTAWHWLQMHILESPVKLLVCCLYQCFVSPAEHQPALGKVHAKSITQFLSAFLLKEQLSPSCMPVAQSCNAQETQSLSLFFFLCYVAPCCSPCDGYTMLVLAEKLATIDFFEK